MSTPDPRELRNALGAFLTGVTVVTTRTVGGERRGFTANSFTSVSLDPPLVLVFLATTSSNHAAFTEGDGFAINVLAEEQREVAARFASRVEDRFGAGAWADGPAGHPVLDGAASWFDCTLERTIDGGDHVILLGRVQGFATTGANPRGYLRGSYVTPSLAQDALAHAGGPTRVGAILEGRAGILLVEDEDGQLNLPMAGTLGSDDDPSTLYGRLHGLGVQSELGFLYAVYEDVKGTTWVFHRGELLDGPHPGRRALVVRPEELPWERIGDAAVASMLRRYVAERAQARFGVYVGDAEAGLVRPIHDTTDA